MKKQPPAKSSHVSAKRRVLQQVNQHKGGRLPTAHVDAPVGSSDHPLTPQDVLQLQHVVGNQGVLQLLQQNQQADIASVTTVEQMQSAPLQTTLQRQAPVDGGSSAGGVADPVMGPPLPTFDSDMYLQEGKDFDSAYVPVGPLPQVGELEIVHRVHIDFKPFTRRMMRRAPFREHFRDNPLTEAQRADFGWADDEKQQFADDFVRGASGAWSDQFTFSLNESGFAAYRCNVKVKFELMNEPDDVHTKITAQKVPADLPRLRSEVKGDEATLDSRDPSEPDASGQVVEERPFIRQIGAFDLASSDLSPLLADQVRLIDLHLQLAKLRPDAMTRDWELHIIGVASSEGSEEYNRDLGQSRAQTVKDNISADISWIKEVNVASNGELKTTTEERFRMVIVTLQTADSTLMFQDTAAHEAGHMLGLGDEYTERDAPDRRFPGDEPWHHEDVEEEMDITAANDLLVNNSDSIMSAGNDVLPGHYVYFLKAIKELTGNNKWTVDS